MRTTFRNSFVQAVTVAALLGLACSACLSARPTQTGTAAKVVKLALVGDSRELRERAEGAPRSSPGKPPILLLLLDGVDRSLLYDMLRGGELPALATLLGGDSKLSHAYLDETMVATLPSSTAAAWATALTGVGPARHGITGNEFFVRERRIFGAPVPVTFADSKPVLACFVDDYEDKLRLAPTVYERMRERDPHVLVWVAMHPIHGGADRLLLTERAVIAKAFEGFAEQAIEKLLTQKESRDLYARLDRAVMDVVISELDDDPVPDVLTVYVSGTDSFAHVADDGPDEARRAYLREVLEPQFARLAKKLDERGALRDRFVVLTSDHGHTEVVKDDAHALSMKGKDDPPHLLERAGFRPRPFQLEVDEDDDFDVVLAYQGAMAFVYVANRSRCASKGTACDWSMTPRFEEDVLAVAEAFHRNDVDGSYVPEMKGTLDLVLARRPVHHEETDAPFEVYVGGGELVPVSTYLARHPHPSYVALEARLRDLAVGPHGERAGDVVLIAHNGDRDRPDDRYYFAARYRSWHGSPSKRDSEIPLIVAHPKKSRDALRALARRAIGDEPRQQKLTDLLLALRAGAKP